MSSATGFALGGALFVLMTLVSAALRRIPLTAAIVYLLVGALLGKGALGVFNLYFIRQAGLVRLLTEIALLISLFTAGLKLRLPISSPLWRTPLLLASVSMLMTISATALFAYWVLGMPWGACVLLGGILAPTDPVLASNVQVLGPEDQDRLRFSLTAEAGLNDGAAFPVVLLGLGLLGLRDIGPWGGRWLLIDVAWGVVAGLIVGSLLAGLIGRLVAYLRAKHRETESYDDFLAIGLIGLSYGCASLLHASGFLAVFAAGLALRRVERMESHRLQIRHSPEEHRIHEHSVSAVMAGAVLRFNEQLERIGELGIVIMAGALLSRQYFSAHYLSLVAALFLLFRPLSVFAVIRRGEHSHRMLISWFGIRGIGPIYYAAFALEQGLPSELSRAIVGITLTVVVASIFLHGLSAAPLMLKHARSNA